MRVPLNVGLNPNERFDLSVQPVRHQLKFSIWRDKRDSSVVLKPRETHTLMKLDILKLNCFWSCSYKRHKRVQIMYETVKMWKWKVNNELFSDYVGRVGKVNRFSGWWSGFIMRINRHYIAMSQSNLRIRKAHIQEQSSNLDPWQHLLTISQAMLADTHNIIIVISCCHGIDIKSSVFLP